MKLWTYRHRFEANGETVELESIAGVTTLTGVLKVGGVERARDLIDFSREPVRNLRLQAELAAGQLQVEAGYNSWLDIGVRATLAGTTVYESHPGRPIAMPARARRAMESYKGKEGLGDRFATHKWAIYADIALAILFFAVAKLTDLRTAALTIAFAGLALILVQRFVTVDLLGGMALFGIVMTLLGAGFAIAFDDDRMIQLRPTILGLIGAGFFLADAAAGGRYLGRRIGIYLPGETEPRRLAFAFGITGLVMAGLNWLVLSLLSRDAWLLYATFLDVPVSVALVFWAISFARPRQPAVRL